MSWLQGALKVSPKTGVYDAATLDAVKAYQRDNGLTETGLVDAATLELLNGAA